MIKIVYHSDVVGASPVGTAPTTSSFLTSHLASVDCAMKTVRQETFKFKDLVHLILETWRYLIKLTHTTKKRSDFILFMSMFLQNSYSSHTISSYELLVSSVWTLWVQSSNWTWQFLSPFSGYMHFLIPEHHIWNKIYSYTIWLWYWYEYLHFLTL